MGQSHLGLVPKDGSGWRVIEDASQPEGDSVNDWTKEVKQKYECWARVVEHLEQAPRGSFLLKYDKHDAYPSIAVRAQDHHLLGFHVTDLGYFYSSRMRFGFRASAYIWGRFMDLFQLLYSKRRQVPRSELHDWVDDGLDLTGSACATVALRVRECLLSTARRYNFHLHPSKFSLSRVAVYLGIEIDMCARTLTIPAAKLAEIRTRLSDALGEEAWSKVVVQRVLGSLNHVARVLPQARAFVGRLIAVLRAHPDGSSFAPPAGARADLTCWLAILKGWSGTALARLQLPLVRPSVRVFIDAFGGSRDNQFAGIGFFVSTSGAFALHEFTAEQRRLAHVQETYSTLLIEFSAIVGFLSTFGPSCAGSVVEVACDNWGAVAVAESGFSADPTIGGMCRIVTALSIQFELRIQFTPIRSQDNLADQLSRGSIAGFLAETRAAGFWTAPSATPFRSPPQEICELLQCSFFLSR